MRGEVRLGAGLPELGEHLTGGDVETREEDAGAVSDGLEFPPFDGSRLSRVGVLCSRACMQVISVRLGMAVSGFGFRAEAGREERSGDRWCLRSPRTLFPVKPCQEGLKPLDTRYLAVNVLQLLNG